MTLSALLAIGENGRRPGLCIPGCWDGFSALMIEQAGFSSAFLTGGGLSIARLGQPDMGLVTASELINTAMQITDRISIPLIVDADTGFGNALTLQRCLRQLEKAGVAAVTIEDQRFPKRCGHMEGKEVVPQSEACGRIRAAKDAIDAMVVIARTDALAIEGPDAAMDRAEMYLEAGADMLFIEGARDMNQIDAISARFASRVPLFHNLVEGPHQPTSDSADLFARGYAATLHPLILLHGMAALGPKLLKVLKQTGSTQSLGDDMIDLIKMNELTDARQLIAKEGGYGG